MLSSEVACSSWIGRERDRAQQRTTWTRVSVDIITVAQKYKMGRYNLIFKGGF